MTYSNIAELPASVRSSLRQEDQASWMKAYNDRLADLEAGKSKPFDGMDKFQSASIGAWKDSMQLPTSRSFVAQISAEVVDLQGDKVPIDELYSKSKEYLLDGGIGHSEHTSKPTYTFWNVEKGVDEKTGEPSVIAYGNFHRDEPLYDMAWSKFVSGAEDEFSIGATVDRKFQCDRKGCYTTAHPTQVFEVSTTKKGANPRTGVLWVNVPQGEGEKKDVKMMETNFVLKSLNAAEECPIKTHYLDFKNRMMGLGITSNWIPPTIALSGGKLGSDEASALIKEFYPDAYISTAMPKEDGTLTQVIVLRNGVQPASQKDIVFLIIDELEAIDGYNAVITSVSNADIDDESKKFITDKLKEIINDEVDHARIDYDILVRELLPPEEVPDDAFAESSQEVATKSCPFGQHEHPGVVGCHDVNQIHDEPKHLPAANAIDLTDEHIDVNAILHTDTPRLQALVKGLASALQGRGDDEISSFMRSPMGKELVLMILELKKRKLQSEGGNDMSEEKKVDPAPAEVVKSASIAAPTVSTVAAPATTDTVTVATKGDIDNLGAMEDMASLLASMKAQLDTLCASVKGLEAKAAMGNGTSASIASAVGQAVDGLTGGKETAEDGKGGEAESEQQSQAAGPGMPEHKEPDGDEGTGQPAQGVPAKEEPDGDESKAPAVPPKEAPAPVAKPEAKPEAVPPKEAPKAAPKEEEKQPPKKEPPVAQKSEAPAVETPAESAVVKSDADVTEKCHGAQAAAIHAEEADDAKTAEKTDTKVAEAPAEHKEPDGDEGTGAPAVGVPAKEEPDGDEKKAAEEPKKEVVDEKCNGTAVKAAEPVSIPGVPPEATKLAAFLTSLGLGGQVTAEVTGTPGRMDYQVQYKSANSDVVVVKPDENLKLANADMMGGKGPISAREAYAKLLRGDDSAINSIFGGK